MITDRQNYPELAEFIFWENDLPYWKKKPNKGTNIGALAGYLRHEYRVIRLHRIDHQAHNLRWFMEYGWLPIKPKEVDHKNKIRYDNKIDNLRIATRSQQQRNRKSGNGSSSRYIGVFKNINKLSITWRAYYKAEGVRYIIGTYETELEAAIARDCAVMENGHDDFTTLNGVL